MIHIVKVILVNVTLVSMNLENVVHNLSISEKNIKYKNI